MQHILDHPTYVFLVAFCGLWLASWTGARLRTANRDVVQEGEHFDLIAGATLTLLGLIIGFSFSMAVSRYDLRMSREETEANAIGTEYLRADLLPAASAVSLHNLLKAYLDDRIQFYETRNAQQLRDINARTLKLQNELWSAVQSCAVAQPNPITALAVSGMNEVLDSQGYTQAAWLNRIPASAWGLIGATALFSNVLIGFGLSMRRRWFLLVILPLVISVALFLIADIDSPRGGMIRVIPQNLVDLAESWKQ